MKNLKEVYKTQTEVTALVNLNKLDEKCGNKYQLPIKSWINNCHNLSVFFKYLDELRKRIYTTNPVENLHRQFRKFTKNRSFFPSNESLTKRIHIA